MKRKGRSPRKTIRSWAQARTALERWRRNLASVEIDLRQPRAIDPVPTDFIRGEPAERPGQPQQKFLGRLITSRMPT